MRRSLRLSNTRGESFGVRGVDVLKTVVRDHVVDG